MEIPSLRAQQALDIEKKAKEEYGVDSSILVENTARAGADFVRQEVGALSDLTIIVMAGKGNNGSDALACARHLANGGAQVTAVLGCHASELKGLTEQHANVASAMGIDMVEFARHGGRRMLARLKDADVVIDGLLGVSITGDPQGSYADMIRMVNDFAVPVLSLDIPSGLHPDTGVPGDPTIQAAWTLTLGFPKEGLLEEAARAYVGKLWLADIGIPQVICEDIGISVESIFSEASIVELE